MLVLCWHSLFFYFDQVFCQRAWNWLLWLRARARSQLRLFTSVTLVLFNPIRDKRTELSRERQAFKWLHKGHEDSIFVAFAGWFPWSHSSGFPGNDFSFCQRSMTSVRYQVVSGSWTWVSTGIVSHSVGVSVKCLGCNFIVNVLSTLSDRYVLSRRLSKISII